MSFCIKWRQSRLSRLCAVACCQLSSTLCVQPRARQLVVASGAERMRNDAGVGLLAPFFPRVEWVSKTPSLAKQSCKQTRVQDGLSASMNGRSPCLWQQDLLDVGKGRKATRAGLVSSSIVDSMKTHSPLDCCELAVGSLFLDTAIGRIGKNLNADGSYAASIGSCYAAGTKVQVHLSLTSKPKLSFSKNGGDWVTLQCNFPITDRPLPWIPTFHVWKDADFIVSM
jgi:hypothetical protein